MFRRDQEKSRKGETAVPGKPVKEFNPLFDAQRSAKERKRAQRSARASGVPAGVTGAVLKQEGGSQTTAMNGKPIETRTVTATQGISQTAAPDELLTKRELAARLGKAIRTLEYWQKRGFIPYLKVGTSVLYSWNDVCRYLRQQNAMPHAKDGASRTGHQDTPKQLRVES